MTTSSLSIKSLASFAWKFIRLQPWTFFFIYLLSLTWSVDGTLWPYLLRQIIDTLTQFESNRFAAWSILEGLLVNVIIFWVMIEIGFRMRDFLIVRAFPRMEAAVRMAMFDHVQHHSPKYFNEHFAGSLSNKIGDMTTSLTSMMLTGMVFVSAIGASILILAFFAAVNPFFAGVLAVWIATHFAICLFFSKKCVQYSDAHGEERSKLAGKIVDSFTNNFAVNLFARFKSERARIAINQGLELEKNIRAQTYVAYMLLALTIAFLVGTLTLNSLLISFWMQSKITTGEVIQVFNTTFNVIMVLWVAGDLMPQFFKAFGTANQALTVMNDPQDVLDPPDALPLVVNKGEIIFDKVSFQYGEKKLFEEKEVHIKGGEKVGLVGYSGAGKSTFVNLILRLYPISKGKILIDTQDIAAVTLDSLRKQVTLIPQDPLLFHRTLGENIQFGNPDANKEEVIKAAKLAHCHEFIEKYPNGYETLVGERGTKISGGERQRIAIARAMLTDSPILILDEATSSLDSITENYIQESLELLMKNRTTIVIAHRLSTLSKMDRILVFDGGKVVEEGTHQQLIALNGHYSRLWQMQAGGFLPSRPS